MTLKAEGNPQSELSKLLGSRLLMPDATAVPTADMAADFAAAELAQATT